MRTTMTLLVTMGLLQTAAWAQEPAPQPSPESSSSVRTLTEVCGLTAEQQTQVATREQTMVAQVSAYKTEHAAEIAAATEAVSRAAAGGDAEALAAAKKAYDQLMAPLATYAHSFYDDVLALMTPEQKAKWLEHQAVLCMKAVYGPLDLTESQIAQIRTAYATLAATAGLTREQLMTRLAAKVKDEILTAKQLEKYAKATKLGPFGTKVF